MKHSPKEEKSQHKSFTYSLHHCRLGLLPAEGFGLGRSEFVGLVRAFFVFDLSIFGFVVDRVFVFYPSLALLVLFLISINLALFFIAFLFFI